MSHTIAPVSPLVSVGAWLAKSGLNEADAALAKVHWRSAERLSGLLFGLIGLVSRAYGPDRLEQRVAPASLRIRYL